MELTWGMPPAALAAALEAELNGHKVGLAWLDVETGRGWVLNDGPRPAASLIKVFLAVAAYQAAERGELDLRERVPVAPLPEDDEAEFDDLGKAPDGQRFAWRKVIDRMLTESDNAATNALVDRLGPTAVGDLTRQLHLRHTVLARRMLDVAARQAGRENFTTGAELATVLAALRRGELLGPAYTAELLALLGQQRHTEKLASGLPADVVFRHKTGELPGYRHDGGIVEAERPYVLAALAEAPAGRERDVDALLGRVAAIVHAHHGTVEAELTAARAWLDEVRATHDPRLEATELTIEPGPLPRLVGHTTHAPYLEPPADLALHVAAVHTQPTRGVVIVPCLQLRQGPGHSRELVSQLRLGDPVEVLESVEDWHRLRGPDGYVAWGRSNNLKLDAAWAPTHMVVAPSVSAALPEGRRLVLSAGSRLEAAGPEGMYRLPNGSLVGLGAGVAPLGRRLGVADMLAFAHEFLGLPYLWGGTTCWGLDCSGLVQLSHLVCGARLPRDADQQQEATGRVSTQKALAPGDLVFFPGHVGIWLGQGRYIHASAQSAVVTLNSFDPADPLYDAKLHGMFSGGGRSPLASPAHATR